jgi:GNAT superfamily N-acetyltransferase
MRQVRGPIPVTPPGMAAELWNVLGRHGMLLYQRPTFTGWATEHAFAWITGEPNVDSNICSLHGEATADDARQLLTLLDAAGVPAVIPVSTSVSEAAIAPVLAAGFEALEPEVAMWRGAGPLEPRAHAFSVRVALTDADIAASSRVITEAHGTAPGIVERAFNLDALRAGLVHCYVAWDGDRPASTGWFVHAAGYVSVHEMMTAPAHRRQGAGRAILETALSELAGFGPEGTLLWASPSGMPLYESVGFVAFDEVVPWVRGATDAELAAIGASPAAG